MPSRTTLISLIHSICTIMLEKWLIISKKSRNSSLIPIRNSWTARRSWKRRKTGKYPRKQTLSNRFSNSQFNLSSPGKQVRAVSTSGKANSNKNQTLGRTFLQPTNSTTTRGRTFMTATIWAKEVVVRMGTSNSNASPPKNELIINY